MHYPGVVSRADVWNCDEATIGRLVDSMKYERFLPGTVLCRQGDVADRFFVIVTGQCSDCVER